MEECNKSYGANNHTSLLSHAQSQSQMIDNPAQNVIKIAHNLPVWTDIDNSF